MVDEEVRKKAAKILKGRKMSYERVFKEEFILSSIEELDYGWEVYFSVDRKPLPLWGNHLYVSNHFLIDNENKVYYVPHNGVYGGAGYRKYYAEKRKSKRFVLRTKLYNFICDSYEKIYGFFNKNDF